MVRDLIIKSRAIHEAKPLGRWQVVLLCLALLAAGGTVLLYAQTKRWESQGTEARDKFNDNQLEMKRLEERLEEIRSKDELDLPTPESIRASLNRFETEFLASAEEAELAVIQEVNRLARESGVSLPDDINFDSIEQIFLDEEGGQSAGRRSGDSPFPGLEMSFTVEGSYADLRRFLLELEKSQAFLIINSLDLKSVEQSGVGVRSRPGSATSQVVVLGIKLSVYYQREAP